MCLNVLLHGKAYKYAMKSVKLATTVSQSFVIFGHIFMETGK
jgi:hypothetical protein